MLRWSNLILFPICNAFSLALKPENLWQNSIYVLCINYPTFLVFHLDLFLFSCSYKFFFSFHRQFNIKKTSSKKHIKDLIGGCQKSSKKDITCTKSMEVKPRIALVFNYNQYCGQENTST